MKSLRKLKKIKGDASVREFYRNKKNKSIFVLSKKEKLQNLLIYDAINKILIKNKILAPKLLSENYLNNYIEIQDFGDQTLFEILKNKKNNKYIIFKKIVKILNRMQLIKDIRIKNLILKLNYKNDTFVHRDFHVSNLMYCDKKIGLIDSQDALIGNKAYDLASLIDDVRLKTSNKLKEKVFKFYISTNKKIELKKFQKDFHILSVLRNLKIIGIFTRLALRDNKKKYLKLIPYAWEMINYRIKKQNDLKNLMLLLRNNFPKSIR